MGEAPQLIELREKMGSWFIERAHCIQLKTTGHKEWKQKVLQAYRDARCYDVFMQDALNALHACAIGTRLPPKIPEDNRCEATLCFKYANEQGEIHEVVPFTVWFSDAQQYTNEMSALLETKRKQLGDMTDKDLQSHLDTLRRDNESAFARVVVINGGTHYAWNEDGDGSVLLRSLVDLTICELRERAAQYEYKSKSLSSAANRYGRLTRQW
jgi:hypothetical protein